MQSIALTIHAPDGAEVAVAVIVRPKRLSLRPKLAQRVIETTGTAVPVSKPTLRLVRGLK
jgi:hypothetical protein